jgi:hypothetical protein
MQDRMIDTQCVTTTPGLTKGLLFVLLACVVFAFSPPTAFAADEIADKLSAELIYPDAIEEGESFTLFAYVTNNTSLTLYVEIYASERSYAAYDYRTVRIPGVRSHLLAPGESRYVTAGRYYYAGETLNSNTIVLDDLVMRYSEPDQNLVTAPTLPLQVISIDALDTGKSQLANPALYPIPDRQALSVKDLVAAGDNVLIHDPNTGYDWIQLGETTHLTLQDVQYALSTNANLQGFQLARASQVMQLLLNHIHAAGIAAQLSDLPLVPPHHLVSSIADFVELFGPGQGLRNAKVIYGAVADEPVGAIITDTSLMGGLAISGHRDPPCDTFFCPATGVSPIGIVTESNDDPQPRYGFWLVRGAPELTRPSDRASFLDNQLVIPSVQIDGSYYRAVLSVLDLKHNLFIQTRLNTIDASSNTAVFNSSTGLLELPEAVLIDADGAQSTANLTFRLVPDTMPPVLELIGLTE